MDRGFGKRIELSEEKKGKVIVEYTERQGWNNSHFCSERYCFCIYCGFPRLDFRRSLAFGYPPREETAGRVSDRLCL